MELYLDHPDVLAGVARALGEMKQLEASPVSLDDLASAYRVISRAEERPLTESEAHALRAALTWAAEHEEAMVPGKVELVVQARALGRASRLRGALTQLDVVESMSDPALADEANRPPLSRIGEISAAPVSAPGAGEIRHDDAEL